GGGGGAGGGKGGSGRGVGGWGEAAGKGWGDRGKHRARGGSGKRWATGGWIGGSAGQEGVKQGRGETGERANITTSEGFAAFAAAAFVVGTHAWGIARQLDVVHREGEVTGGLGNDCG